MDAKTKAPIIEFVLAKRSIFKDMIISEAHGKLKKEFPDIPNFSQAVTEGIFDAFDVEHKRGRGSRSASQANIKKDEFDDFVNLVKKTFDAQEMRLQDLESRLTPWQKDAS